MRFEIQVLDTKVPEGAPKFRIVRGVFLGETEESSKEWAAAIPLDGQTPEQLSLATQKAIASVARLASEALQ